MSNQANTVPNGQPATNSGQSTKLNLPSGGSTVYELKKLREIHHLILRLYAAGMKQNDIADQLNVHKQMVHYTVNCELGQQKLKILRGEADLSSIDVLEQYNELAPLAVETLEGIMLSTVEKASDRIRAAENILGGAGYGKRERLDIHHHGVTDDEIAEAKKRALEKGRGAGLVVDHEVEDAKVLSESE